SCSPETLSSKSSTSRSWLSSVRRPRTSPGPRAPAFKRSLLADDDVRRDSALQPSSSNSTAGDHDVAESRASFDGVGGRLPRVPSLPTIVIQDGSRGFNSVDGRSNRAIGGEMGREGAFKGIETDIPSGGFEDFASPSQLEFSKRGSMLLGGKRANKMNKQLGSAKNRDAENSPPLESSPPQETPRPQTPPRQQQLQTPLSPPRQMPRSPPRLTRGPTLRTAAQSTRVLSTDEMTLSRRVRSMYEHGNENAPEWEEPPPVSWRDNPAIDDESVSETPLNGSTLTVDKTSQIGTGSQHSLRTPSFAPSRRESMIIKEPTEAAGGIEDWEDIGGGEVDRYGFILPKKVGSRGSNGSGEEAPRLQRVSTALQIVSEEPRRRRTIRRSPSNARSSRSANPSSRRKAPRSLKPPTGSIYSNKTTTSFSSTQNPIRYAANRLPHNRDRRWMDEAADMLTLPPGLADIAEQEEGGRAALAMKKKEIEREEKWRKMAKVVTKGAKSGGMIFEFDTKDPKLVSRTWKGIPDRWRSTAWYGFLAASAKNDKNSPTDQDLIESFYELQEESSADDMQIDVDVPRTIGGHVMFRRRYRGGQRLLFRVLHAMSLYLPDTGYVQGMAALTATLLCYYDEEKAFVMLVRLWQLRGLERLYESGFDGLMEALDDFEKNWLNGGDVAKKLEELGITSTAYGTRWYLTLFSYSIPFPAQLRVWDVFMLLGDASHKSLAPPPISTHPTTTPSPPPKHMASFSGDLDVLHATSAALIDAMREVLLDSDFENGMKVLTSWIPVKDEDLLMRVAKAEWKMRKKRATT
ncbi:RabGAP/TBC, partial [Mytilinidion resinicola]